MILFPCRGEIKELGDDARTNASGSFSRLSKGLTHYKLSGPSDGKVVVLIHGIGGPFGIWSKIVDSLTSHGFRVLQYDLYGRGYSDRPDLNHDIDLYINQLDDIIKELSIKIPVTLVGWSLGGMIAINYAAKFPKKTDQLALIAPAGIAVSKPMIANILTIPLLGEILMSLFGQSFVIKSLLKGLYRKELEDDYRILLSEQMRYKGYLRSFLSTLRHCVFKDATEQYQIVGNLEIPVLLISGSEDSFITQHSRSRIRELIPTSKFSEISGSGHLPVFEKPEEVSHILINLISSS
ncbi:alpha/beta hydrolase [uncultured Desulfosarcina sp.]|uniref:alpha/beta fold hydrolase n=1 Tax=uncultured Desulfosarcina sp. TaxID=218289 RepID=UPI0029C8116B|nr:alpha/beta hydrolase [uncultured Desulfosarcina sp.]